MQTMPRHETSRVGRRGSIVLPAKLRREYGIDEGTLVIAEGREDGIFIRPAVAVPVEIYTPERIAQFLLMNAIDAEDYAGAREEVIKMGLDPDTISHDPPRIR
jgi:AbrB family looped-hinge helix DNA binding protein